MTTRLPQGPTIDALAEGLAAFEGLLAEVPDEEWARPTALPGWDVHANAAHVLGTESMLLGLEPPPSDVDVATLPHVRNDIGAMNEAWIAGLAGTPPAELRERLRDVVARRLDALRAMSRDDWDAEGFTPAGRDTHGRFMRIRAFDCWMHEQDIRDAVGRPGHTDGAAVELALDEMVTALGYVVGKRAGVPDGSSVSFVLTGPAGRTVHVAVDGRAAVVDALPGPATATLATDVHTFSRVAGGRVDPADATGVELGGDLALAQRVLDHLAYTI